MSTAGGRTINLIILTENWLKKHIFDLTSKWKNAVLFYQFLPFLFLTRPFSFILGKIGPQNISGNRIASGRYLLNFWSKAIRFPEIQYKMGKKCTYTKDTYFKQKALTKLRTTVWMVSLLKAHGKFQFWTFCFVQQLIAIYIYILW